MTGTDEAVQAEQIAYYRARAGEYESTAYPDRTRAQQRVAATVAGLGIAGDVLELACGTGIWTAELAPRARSMSAVDSAPEALALAGGRRLPGVRYERADLFSWHPDRRYDVVFFAFWLSHVPDEQFARFFDRVGSGLVPGGRAVFVDEPPRAAGHEVDLIDGTARRELGDGRDFRIVKVFRDPLSTVARLADLGWTAQVADRGDWLVGQARAEG